MTKGVFSPWTPPVKETPQEKLERLIEEAPNGAPRQTITFDGRAFQIVVAFYSFEKDYKKLSVYAHDALGRALEETLKVDNTLLDEFKRQSIFTDASKLLSPKVMVTLGPIILYVKASSFDPKMAQLMSMDRIALAMADARGSSAKVRKSFDEHDIVVARKI